MKLLAIDSTPLFLAGLMHGLALSAPDIATYSAASLAEVEACYGQLVPDVIILDEAFAERPSSALLSELQTHYPQTPIILTVAQGSLDNAIHALRRGAAGILPKKSSLGDLLTALKHVQTGSVYIPLQLPPSCSAEGPAADSRVPDRLTCRQSQIVKLLMIGASNKQICRQLCLAEGTVKNHLYAIFRLLGVRNRTEAAVWLARLSSEPG